MIQAVDLTLAGATLAGGARLASSGGGLPSRLTTELDQFLDINALVGAVGINGIAFPSDGTSDIISVLTNNTTKRYTGAGSLVWTVASTAGRSLARITGAKVIEARETAGSALFFEIDEATGVLTNKTFGPAATAKQLIVVPGGTANTAWYHSSGTVITEITYSTGAATTRTISGLTGVLAILGSNWNGTPSIFILESSTRITRYNESTLALMDTWTTAPGAGAQGMPGGQFGNSGIWIDSAGRIYVKSEAPYAIDRILSTTGIANLHTSANATSVERVMWGGSEFGGPMQAPTGGGAQFEPGFDISPNGRWFAMVVPTTAPVATRAVTIRNIQTQNVEWTQALSNAVSWIGISMPGNLGNKYGVWPLNWNSGNAADLRTAKFYYQRVGSGGNVDASPVYLAHGAYVPPAGLALAGITSLKVGMDFSRGWGTAPGPEPYIGGPSGEGPRLWIEQGPTLHRSRRRGSL